MAKAYLENGQKDKAKTVVEQMLARDFPPKVVDSVAQLISSSN
jgi:pentatricopeptide repeat protein